MGARFRSVQLKLVACCADGPGLPGAISALSVFLCESVLHGAFVWARRALSSRKRRFPARAEANRVVGGLLAAAPPPAAPRQTPTLCACGPAERRPLR
jgi:hypothetical protein